jgi:hypothetical protein
MTNVNSLAGAVLEAFMILKSNKSNNCKVTRIDDGRNSFTVSDSKGNSFLVGSGDFGDGTNIQIAVQKGTEKTQGFALNSGFKNKETKLFDTANAAVNAIETAFKISS